MKYPKCSPYKYTMKRYRVRNWRSYEAGLRSRGDLTVWILIDSTGLKILFGNRGKMPERRAERKLYVAVHARTGEVVPSDLGSNRARDGCRVPALLEPRVENASYRTQRIIGRDMRARTTAGQRAEMRIGCKVLNTMTSLGMPNSHGAGWESAGWAPVIV